MTDQLKLFADEEGKVSTKKLSGATVKHAADLSKEIVDAARDGDTEVALQCAKELYRTAIDMQSTAGQVSNIYRSTIDYIGAITDHVDIERFKDLP